MPELPADLKKLEAALAGLTPSRGGLNRDRMLYEAGRRSARPQIAAIVAAAFAVIVTTLTMQFALRPEPRVIEVVRFVPAPVPQQIDPSPSPATDTVVVHSSTPQWGNAFRTSAGYFSLRDRAVNFGPDALRTVSPQAATPATPDHPILRGFDDDVNLERNWHRPL